MCSLKHWMSMSFAQSITVRDCIEPYSYTQYMTKCCLWYNELINFIRQAKTFLLQCLKYHLPRNRLDDMVFFFFFFFFFWCFVVVIVWCACFCFLFVLFVVVLFFTVSTGEFQNRYWKHTYDLLAENNQGFIVLTLLSSSIESSVNLIGVITNLLYVTCYQKTWTIPT